MTYQALVKQQAEKLGGYAKMARWLAEPLPKDSEYVPIPSRQVLHRWAQGHGGQRNRYYITAMQCAAPADSEQYQFLAKLLEVTAK